MLCEEIGCRGVSADFHGTQLVELPTVQVGGTVKSEVSVSGDGRVQKNSGVPDEADVHAQVAMDARAI